MATNPVGYGTASAGTASASGGSSNAAATTDTTATKQEFISLLVAQLRNQDPLNPMDGTQFLSQLTEINSFEQLLGIRQDLDKLTGQTSGDSTSAQDQTNSQGG